MGKNITAVLVAMIAICDTVGAGNLNLTSPNSDVSVSITDVQSGGSCMSLGVNDINVIDIPALGIVMDGRESSPWKVKSVVSQRPVEESYEMLTGKRRHCSNKGTEYRLDCSDDGSRVMVVRVYGDGVAFRYECDNIGDAVLADELTTYKIKDGAERWLQEFRNDYENFYPRTASWDGAGKHYGYPMLVHSQDGGPWALISEANVNHGSTASSVKTVNMNEGEYKVFPAGRTSHHDKYVSPWRVVMLGELADIVESTLITDVSDAASFQDVSWIRPGVVSWIYWGYNRGSKDYQIVKRYIDMAADLGLPYVLIDWEWDVMANGGDIDDAIAYADARNVKVLVWYNSSTAWVDQVAGPLFRLNKPEDREKEFAWLESKGVAGVKIDFFCGDGPEVMDYCTDILESAARHHLLVNFHGATIPRGWQRTYPNFMSAEAVYGAEWYNNGPALTQLAASHNATLPFTRNVVGPMDYTPCAFSDSQNPHITTEGHELALTVVFESALQHLADKPEVYLGQPEEIRAFLGALPSVWEDTKLLSGFPGRHVALARESGGKWYVGLLNGTEEPVSIKPEWSVLNLNNGRHTLYTDGESGWRIEENVEKLPSSIKLAPRGGAVFVIEK